MSEELELPEQTIQVIRRTIATLAQKKGTPKDIQGVLRHSRLSTTIDVYMQDIPESVKVVSESCTFSCAYGLFAEHRSQIGRISEVVT